MEGTESVSWKKVKRKGRRRSQFFIIPKIALRRRQQKKIRVNEKRVIRRSIASIVRGQFGT